MKCRGSLKQLHCPSVTYCAVPCPYVTKLQRWCWGATERCWRVKGQGKIGPHLEQITDKQLAIDLCFPIESRVVVPFPPRQISRSVACQPLPVHVEAQLVRLQIIYNAQQMISPTGDIYRKTSNTILLELVMYCKEANAVIYAVYINRTKIVTA